MPTWPPPFWKTRSPGCGLEVRANWPEPKMADVLDGMLIPACAYAHAVKPEQSQPPGPLPPHTYGVPTPEYAAETTAPNEPDEEGAGASRGSGVEAGSVSRGVSLWVSVGVRFWAPPEGSAAGSRVTGAGSGSASGESAAGAAAG